MKDIKKNEISVHCPKCGSAFTLDNDKKVKELLTKELDKLDQEKKDLKESLRNAERKSYAKAFDQFNQSMEEKDKKIRDIERKLQEAQRAVHQAPAQVQGRVYEDLIQEKLKNHFQMDQFEGIKTGQSGGDLIHHVYNEDKELCGTILYEFKSTKIFQSKWVEKLRQDQEVVKADLAVIMTKAMPTKKKYLDFKDNIYIVESSLGTAFVAFLRNYLIELKEKQHTQVDVKKKADLLYDYITGGQFKQKFSNIIQTYKDLKDDLDREKRSLKKLWAQREKRLEMVLQSSSGLLGDLSAITQKIEVEQNTSPYFSLGNDPFTILEIGHE